MDPLAAAKRTKKTVTLILVFTAILAVASLITGYFYLKINDISPQNTNASQGCGCYFVAATDTVKSCADANPKMAYEFQTGTIQSNNNCSASCDLRTASSLKEENQTTLACRVDDFAINPGCVDISIEDSAQKRYANKVEPGQKLTIKAKFTTPKNITTPDQDFYSGFSFVVNGAKTEMQKDQATSSGTGVDKEYLVTTTIPDYSTSDTLSIQAFGQSTTGAQITSEACNRVLTVNKPNAPTCTELRAEVVNDTNQKPKVNEINLSMASVTPTNTLSVKFTVGKTGETLTTKNIKSQMSGSSLVLTKSFLYSASNFIDGKSFSVIDDEMGTLNISSQVYVDGSLINSDNCIGEFEIPAIQEGPKNPVEETPEEPNEEEPEEEEPTNPQEEKPNEETETSDFTLDKTASVACVERSNSLTYTISIHNTDSDDEGVTRIEDKLPLGFTYKTNSTYINGSLVDDSDFIDVETVGSTQQITFSTNGGWTIDSGDSLTIRFSANVSSSALSGSNLNEAIAIPVNTPKDDDSLRSSVSVSVSQNCTSPETALFDSTISRVALAVFTILLGLFFYFSQSGLNVSNKLINSTLGKTVRNIGLKSNDPQRYFEEKFIEKLEKNKTIRN